MKPKRPVVLQEAAGRRFRVVFLYPRVPFRVRVSVSVRPRETAALEMAALAACYSERSTDERRLWLVISQQTKGGPSHPAE